MAVVVPFPMTELARARVVIGLCLAEYARAPHLQNARELILSVQAWPDHLEEMGVTRRARESFADMDPHAVDEKGILICANVVMRALRQAEKRVAVR